MEPQSKGNNFFIIDSSCIKEELNISNNFIYTYDEISDGINNNLTDKTAKNFVYVKLENIDEEHRSSYLTDYDEIKINSTALKEQNSKFSKQLFLEDSDLNSIQDDPTNLIQQEYNIANADSSSYDDDFILKISDTSDDKLEENEIITQSFQNALVNDNTIFKTEDNYTDNNLNITKSKVQTINKLTTRSYETRGKRKLNTSEIISPNSFVDSNILSIESTKIKYDNNINEKDVTENLLNASESKINISNFILRFCLRCKNTSKCIGQQIKKCQNCKVDLKFKCLLCEKYCKSKPGVYSHLHNYHLSNSNYFNRNQIEINKCSILFCLKCNNTCKVSDKKIVICQKCKVKMAMVCLICSRHYKTVTEFYSHLHKEHPKHFSKNQDHLKQSVKDRDYLKQLIKDQEQSNNFVKTQEHLKYFEQAQENPKHFTKYEEDFKCSIKDQDYAKYFINDAKNINNKDVINKKMCVKCGIQFQSNQSWFNHNKYCGKEPHLSCKYCPHKTKYKWNLKQHNELKHSSIISSKLKLKSGFLESVSEKESKGDDSPFITTPNKLSILNMTKYYCHKCDQTINDIQKFDKICKKCGKELTLQCIKCNRFYKKYQSMIYHLQSKCDPQTYFHCSKCDYTTSVSNLIKKHVLRVHGINYKTNTKKCTKCGKRCRSLFEHTRSCEKESNNVIRNLSDIRKDKKSFIKNLGSRVSPRKNEIINTVHSSNNTKECLKCGKTYKNINHHIEFCQRDKIFSCELCTFKTKYKYNLNYHIQTHKSKTEAAKIKAQDGLEQVLKQTKKVIKQNNAIKLKMHNVMESYCPKCSNKNIANKYVTKCRKCRTRLTFRCIQCNVKYRKLASLQMHTKNHNFENSGNIECTNCNKTFALKKNFRMHRNICMKELSCK